MGEYIVRVLSLVGAVYEMVGFFFRFTPRNATKTSGFARPYYVVRGHEFHHCSLVTPAGGWPRVVPYIGGISGNFQRAQIQHIYTYCMEHHLFPCCISLPTSWCCLFAVVCRSRTCASTVKIFPERCGYSGYGDPKILTFEGT